MQSKVRTYFGLAAWLLSAVVTAAAVIAWGQLLHWRFEHLSTYQLFPLFGLLAFSIMWSHYIVAALRTYLGVAPEKTHQYFEMTSFVVLLALVLHPGLLVWQLWRDGFGLPPNSYLQHFVAPSLHWAATLGFVSLLLFLAYELRRLYGNRSWWHFVGYGSDVAMLAIFFHGLRLGDNLQIGWFRALWFVYGVTLAGALIYVYQGRYRARLTEQE
jgi:hypothetical protein